jgi:5-methylthioadenosine/S-adenosylhomocysteine deaminase
MPTRYVLTGRIVTVDLAWTVHDSGALYIADDRIVRIQDDAAAPPPGFDGAPRIATKGTIYPGLIELHNHLSYNALPLWPPLKVYENRGQWAGIEPYRKSVSGPMTVLGKTLGLPQAVVRYVECKCLVAGVTTSQGVALYSNNGIQKFYRGNIRNVEDTREVDLDDALTKIADVEATKAKDFLTRLKKTHKLILHLAEGLGPTARVHFTALHLADDSWALAPSLVAIHANGLDAGDFAVLHDHGVGIVWSPLSNLLLYGGTTNIVAARANDVPVALGSDWSPSGSRNLLAELKIARIVNAGLSPSPYKDRDLVAMATRNPATMLGWGDQIGSLADGHYADLLVVAGTDGDPYDHLLTASERDIDLVVIDGVARFGRASLIAAAAPGASFETVKIGGLSRRLNLVEANADPVVGGLTLGAARTGLTNALANLAALAKLLEDPPPGAALAALTDPTPQWFLELDHDEPAGVATRPHLPGPDGKETGRVEMSVALASKPLSTLLEPMTLDPLTVADEPGYWARLAALTNIPEPIRDAMAKLND